MSATTTAFASSTALYTAHTPDYKILKKEYGEYPIIYNQINATTTYEKQTDLIKPEIISGVISISNKLKQGRVAIVNYFVIENPGAGVTVYTNQPWKIFLQPLNDIDAQIANLKIILASNHPIEYVDLRFGEKVYWK